MHQALGQHFGLPKYLKEVSAVTDESIIRYAPIIVPIILAAGIVAVRVYRPPQMPSSPAVADVAARSCGDAGRECPRLRPSGLVRDVAKPPCHLRG
jgi:hypothetical protein